MPDETVLRAKAKAVIEAGKLSTRPPDRTWGGPGLNVPCVICDRPVSRDELEFEIEFALDADGLRWEKFHLHLRCLSAWEFERTKVGRVAAQWQPVGRHQSVITL